MSIRLGTKQLDTEEIVFSSWFCAFCIDKNEVINGYGFIIPKRVVKTPFELRWYEWISIGRMLLKARNYIKSQCSPDGYNIGWNVGRSAGQNYLHVHMHIIPRHNGDAFDGNGLKKCIKNHIIQ